MRARFLPIAPAPAVSTARGEHARDAGRPVSGRPPRIVPFATMLPSRRRMRKPFPGVVYD
jgi:hypothetical protein